MDNSLEYQLEVMARLMDDKCYDELETELKLRAAVLGWTGDPLRQPVESVLAATRTVLRRRGVNI